MASSEYSILTSVLNSSGIGVPFLGSSEIKFVAIAASFQELSFSFASIEIFSVVFFVLIFFLFCAKANVKQRKKNTKDTFIFFNIPKSLNANL
ncbi:MAG: hypothetical protein ACKO8L_07580, partial [Flavobacterium sp.]